MSSTAVQPVKLVVLARFQGASEFVFHENRKEVQTVKHLNLDLEKLEQRIAPGGFYGGGGHGGGSASGSGSSRSRGSRSAKSSRSQSSGSDDSNSDNKHRKRYARCYPKKGANHSS